MSDEQVKDKVTDDPKSSKSDKDKKGKKGKKKKEPGKVRRWFKDFFSELKKVTWPTFGKVVKQTGTVLLVTVCFLIVMLAFDALFGYLNHLLMGGLSVDSVSALTELIRGGGGLF